MLLWVVFVLVMGPRDSWSQWQGRPSIVEAGLSLLVDGLSRDMKEPGDARVLLKEYDFIIVGAGTAGCTLANRLTEVHEWTVLLIEAGDSEIFLMDIPILVNYLQFTPANWGYKSEPSPGSCLGMVNQQCNLPRGKVMGGTSVLNYMVHNRGSRQDYNHWSDLGNVGWSYHEVLPYFIKSEDMLIPELARDWRYHNVGGYLPVSNPPFRTPLATSFLEAGLEMGQRIVDYNADSPIGFSYLQTNMKNGTRWSASSSFLKPIRNRRNLHVKKRSHVTRILIDAKTKQAYGVEYQRDGRTYGVKAKREVIVAAGAINSPQLLMLSGIGPKKHLHQMKIPVVQDLKVGFNLQDHIGIGGITFLVNQSVTLRHDELLNGHDNYVNYLGYRRGPWSVPGGIEALAFYDFDHGEDPDVEILIDSGFLGGEPTLKVNFGIKDDLYDTVYKPIADEQAFLLIPILMHPKSRGRIMLKNTNPRAKPLIYTNYLRENEDVDMLIKGAKKCVEITRTNAFRKFGTQLHDIPIPACSGIAFGSDQYWACMARQLTFTIYHQSGTCKMGPKWDRAAVVDPRLRVYGIKGLRVIDASVFPKIPAAHTNAPVHMVAEKGADMIKQDWGEFGNAV